jgi:hypothetical protein
MKLLFKRQQTIRRVERLEAESFDRDFRRLHTPVIITGTLEHWRHLRNFDAFKEKFGPCKLQCDYSQFDGSNASYHEVAALGEYIDLARNNPVYIQLRSITGMPVPESLQPLFDTFPPLDYIEDALMCKTFWIGNSHPGFGLHRDVGTDQFLCQLIGKKDFVLIPDDWRNTRAVYPFRFPNPSSFRSRIRDLRNPEFDRFPDFVNAEAHVGRLESGEVLYIPSSWWHEFVPIGPNCSLGFRHLDRNPEWTRLKHVVYSMLSRREKRQSFRDGLGVISPH